MARLTRRTGMETEPGRALPSTISPPQPPSEMAPNAPYYPGNYGVGEPYRAAPRWKRPPPASRRRHLPFRPLELGAALGVALAVDLSVWGAGGPATGGFGLALFFTALPVLLFVAVRRKRRGFT